MTLQPRPHSVSHALDAARKAGAEQADVVLMEGMDIAAGCRLGKQETLERSESSAIGLRVWVGQRQAIASSSDLSEKSIEELAARAVAMAKVATPDPDVTLAPEALWARALPELDLADADEPAAAELYDRALATEHAALEMKGITNSEGAEAHFGRHRVMLATSAGFFGAYGVTSASLSAAVIAGEGDHMQTDYEAVATRHLDDLPTPESVGRKAAERTLKRLHPKKIATCQAPVVFDPRIGRYLLGTFAGAISGGAVVRGTTFLKDALGKAVFGSEVNIVDDPLIRRGLGSQPFDGEGVRAEKRAMVQGGVVQSWFLDLRTAHRLGMTTTGHASRGLASPPSPAATNLYMEAGSISPEALMKDIKSGFYVTETQGMGVNIVTGDYSQGAAGYWIENGEIAYPVAEVTIAGHMRDMFLGLTPANNLEFRYGTNVPTFRIAQMTVAGN